MAMLTACACSIAWNIVTWVVGVSTVVMLGRFGSCVGGVVFLNASAYCVDSVFSFALRLLLIIFFLSGQRVASEL